MVYEPPTYEEYCKATAYAKVRYKFGVYIQIIATILLLLLFIYAFTNIEEMKTNPADYAEKKLGVTCTYPLNLQVDYNYNGSNRDIRNIEEGW